MGENLRLDLPSDAKTGITEVGKIILQNRSSPLKEIIQLLVNEYSFISDKAEADQRHKEVSKSICSNAANGGLFLAFNELSQLYYKEKNANAGTSYKKVAAAIKDLTFQVTKDNAMGLCKGKTKVPGIGKGSAEKMLEFVTTGKSMKLEEKRGL